MLAGGTILGSRLVTGQATRMAFRAGSQVTVVVLRALGKALDESYEGCSYSNKEMF